MLNRVVSVSPKEAVGLGLPSSIVLEMDASNRRFTLPVALRLDMLAFSKKRKKPPPPALSVEARITFQVRSARD